MGNYPIIHNKRVLLQIMYVWTYVIPISTQPQVSIHSSRPSFHMNEIEDIKDH